VGESSCADCKDCRLCGGKKEVRSHTLHELLIGAWDSAFGENKVTYVSGPITTGIRLFQRILASDTDLKTLKAECFTANSEELKSTVTSLRKKHPNEVFLDPATLNVVGWGQAEYMELWEGFIERHARRVIFLPDWEYSKGCALEYARAVDENVERESASGQTIGVEEARSRIETALAEISSSAAAVPLSDVSDTLKEVLDRLRRHG
jgi:hypothetical protein